MAVTTNGSAPDMSVAECQLHLKDSLEAALRQVRLRTHCRAAITYAFTYEWIQARCNAGGGRRVRPLQGVDS